MKKTAVVLATLMVAACTTSPKNNISQTPQPSEQKKSTTATTAIELSNLAAEIEKLQKQSDYFDYNKFVIKPQYQNVIQKEAEFIKSHKNDVVTLEGNADERGTDEYNLALGEKRADAVQQSLLKYGVPANQIKLVSLGESKPRLTCHKEKCWKENRRVDFFHKLS